MLEVCYAFNMRLCEYQALPAGEKMLYDQFVLVKLGEAAKVPSCPLVRKQ
jgi:hypothetical protein